MTMLHKLGTIALLATAACQQVTDDAGAVTQDDSTASTKDAANADASGNTAGTDGANDYPVRTMTESDRNWLETAAGSCKTGDFGTFLRAFGGSWAVREKYSATKVQFGNEGSSREMQRKQYLGQNNFPITPVDYYWATADSYRNFESAKDPSKLVYVELTFNTASDNRRRVDWVPGRFESQLENPPEELQEGLGNMVERLGKGGYVLFRPTEDCWELVADISHTSM